MKSSPKSQRCTLTILVHIFLIFIGGCGVVPPGPAHVPPIGPEVAVVRPVWGITNVRIRELNGKGVSMLFPDDVVIAPGITRMGLFAWGGLNPTRGVGICVVFKAEAGQNYTVAVDSYRNKWAVSLTLQSQTDKIQVTPLLVRHQESIDELCDGVTL